MTDWTAPESVVRLGDDEAWDLLATIPVGRLATAVAGEPEIFPVNFAVVDREIYVNTTPGSKLAGAAVNPSVAFEADRWDERQAVSVVVKGTVTILDKESDLSVAESTGLVTFTSTEKLEWLRISPVSVTGRRFTRPGPDAA